ncbi:MAG: hypothetical protein ACSLFN_09485 [Candidatus Limnocylindrales bacterium]
MIDRRLAALALFATLALAACAGGGATSAPSAAAPSDAPSAAAGGACAPSTAAATVPVKIADFAFPATVTAKVGDVVGFTNDGAPHTATLDDGSCTTDNIAQGATGSLVFSAAGSSRSTARSTRA